MISECTQEIVIIPDMIHIIFGDEKVYIKNGDENKK